jgi:tetratricopeptide (TPR) repeat protein
MAALIVALGIGSESPAQEYAGSAAAVQGIQWMDDLLFAAWKKAVQESKPLVVYFHHPTYDAKDSEGRRKLCAKLEREVLRTEEFNALAGRAVFAWIDVKRDDDKGNVSRAVKDLKVEATPVVVVLDVRADRIAERDRVTGYFPITEFMERMTKILDAAPAAPAVSAAETPARGVNRSKEAYDRGVALLQEDKSDAAIVCLTEAIRLDPKNDAAYFSRGVAYHETRNLEASMKDFTRAIELNPKFTAAYLNRGICCNGNGDHNAAIADATVVIELNPKEGAAYLCRGIGYRRKGNLRQSLADLATAIALLPSDPWAFYNRGLSYHAQGDLNAALADFTMAIQCNPKFADAYAWRGWMYEKLGKKSEADADRAQAERLGYKYK